MSDTAPGRSQDPAWSTDLAALELMEPVTGDAVALELRPASFASRAVALLIDFVLYALIAIGWLLAFTIGLPSTGIESAAAVETVVRLVSIAFFVGLPVTVETVSRGRSLGKWAMGLQVVRDDGGPIRFRQALVRALLSYLEFYASGFSIALITSLANRRGKRLGDLLAGTYVIRVRTPALWRLTPLTPPELAEWAANLDLGRVPDHLAMTIRQFLRRAAGLNLSSRQRLAESLAAQVAGYVSPAPPPGTHPEAFLAAVMAERYRRDTFRLSAQEYARVSRLIERFHLSPVSATSARLIGEEAPPPRQPPDPLPTAPWAQAR